MDKDFTLYLPLSKAEQDEDGNWILEGPLSSERKDLQGQRMLYDSLSKGISRFASSEGRIVDWNHYSVTKGDPKWIIGEGVDLYDGPAIGGGTTKYLRTKLLKGTEIADQVYRLKQAGKALYYSVGGSCRTKGSDIVDSDINHVAVTPTPANPDALIGFNALSKSLSICADDDFFDTPLEKVLCAGNGPAMGSTGGRALMTEDVEGSVKEPRAARKRRINRRKKSMKKNEVALGDTPLTDPEVTERLEEMEKSGDKNIGLLAGLMKSMGELFKSKSKSKEDEGEDEEDEDPMEEDEDVEPDEDEDDEEKGKKMHKSYEPVSAESVLESISNELKRQIKPLMKSNADLLKSNEALTARVAEMEISSKPAIEFVSELEKCAAPQNMRKSGNAKPIENGANGRTKKQSEELLLKACISGKVDYLTATQMSLSGNYDEDLLKSVEN